MIDYLLKSFASLALLLFFYHLVLEKEKMHSFNRFYLLIGIIASFLIPLTTITVQTIPIVSSTTEVLVKPAIENTTKYYVKDYISNNYTNLLITIYLSISLFFLIRFARNLYKMIRKIRINEKIKCQKAILILVNDSILPYTFWNCIFINKKDYEEKKIEQELFTHELSHVTQRHTFDVLLIELLQIVFWINPLFIFLKKAIQLNHEFLADDTVIHQHKNTFQYQHLLLNKAAWKNEYYLASNLNYLITKKRLKMMTKKSSPVKIWTKKLAVIPLLAGFVVLFAERVEAQVKPKVVEVVEVVEKEKSATRTQMNEYNKLLKSARKENIYKHKDVVKMRAIYRQMSKKQRNSVKNIDDLLPPPPPRPVRIKEVKKEEIFKDEIEEVVEEEVNEKVVEIIIDEKIEEVEEIIEKEHIKKEDFKLPEGKNVTYFIDGKKASKKAVKKLKPNEIKSVDVIKKDGTSTVKIIRN